MSNDEGRKDQPQEDQDLEDRAGEEQGSSFWRECVPWGGSGTTVVVGAPGLGKRIEADDLGDLGRGSGS